MEQKSDYILKMAEAIGRAIAKIIGLKEKGQYHQALQEIYYNHSLFFENFKLEEETDHKVLDQYGSLLFEEIVIRNEINEDDLEHHATQALHSLMRAREISKTFDMQREQKIEILEKYIIDNY